MPDNAPTAGVPTMASEDNSLKKQYEKLQQSRMPVLQRAIQCSELSMPYLQPEESHKEGDELPTPFSSIGAEAVNNLSSKMLVALFPTNVAFFKYTIEEATLQELEVMDREKEEITGESQEDVGVRAKISKELMLRESAVMDHFEKQAHRVKLYHALKLLVATGNVLLNFDEDGKLRCYKLSDYVVKRRGSGVVNRIIIKEAVDIEDLPEDVQDKVKAKLMAEEKDVTSDEVLSNLELYTLVKRKDKRDYEVTQEVAGVPLDNSYTYDHDKYPRYLPLRWTAIDGEDYGRGRVEEYIGDLRSANGATEAILDYGQSVAKIIPLVDPASEVTLKDLEEHENGEYLSGKATDITYAQVQKSHDFGILSNVGEKFERTIKTAFLMNTSAQRNAERVTATEWDYIIQEVNENLGGIYTILAQELQLPLLKASMEYMTNTALLKPLKDAPIEPVITTGLEALGRGQDFNKLGKCMEAIMPLGEEGFKYLNIPDYIARVFTSQGVKTAGLIKSVTTIKNEMAQAQASAKQAQTEESLMSNVHGAIPTIAGKAMDNPEMMEQVGQAMQQIT